MKNVTKRFLIILSLILLAAVSAPLNSAQATTHAWVWGVADAGSYWYWDYDNVPGMTSDTMGPSSVPSYGAVQGYASTSGTVNLYAASYAIQTYAIASLYDTYTFTNLNDPSSTGLISGLRGLITYSGTLSTQNSSAYNAAVFQATEGTVYDRGKLQLIYNNGNYYLTTWDSNGWGIETVSAPTVSLSGSFIFDINGYNYGQPVTFDLTFKADAYGDGSYVDFSDTAVLSFYSTDTNVRLGVTSEGGFNTIPIPGSVLLLGSGLLGLVGWRRFKKS